MSSVTYPNSAGEPKDRYRSLKAGETLQLKLIPKKKPELIRRAMARGRKVVAQVKVRLIAADGTTELQKLRVQIK